MTTLIQDACLEIPSGTTVEVRDSATLLIVATNELRIGKDVRFKAKGAGGNRGHRSAFASVRHEAGSEAEIRALCVEQGSLCPCPAASESLQGQPGGAGSAGGSIQLTAGRLVLADKLNGFTSDVSGGQGGPPGDSGTQECLRGDIRCSSPICSAGATFGQPGSPGKVVLALVGGASAAPIARLSALTTPAGTLTVTELGDSLPQRAVELDREAMQKGWPRRAGRAP